MYKLLGYKYTVAILKRRPKLYAVLHVEKGHLRIFFYEICLIIKIIDPFLYLLFDGLSFLFYISCIYLKQISSSSSCRLESILLKSKISCALFSKIVLYHFIIVSPYLLSCKFPLSFILCWTCYTFLYVWVCMGALKLYYYIRDLLNENFIQ